MSRGVAVEVSDEFMGWWGPSESEQASIAGIVNLLAEFGPNLPFPHSTGISGSRHSAMRELRIQHHGRPYRVLYIFDPNRTAILLLGGDKTGNDRWYERNVPIADRIYDDHVEEIQKEQDNGKAN